MSPTAPVCRTITVFTFRGDRSRRFVAGFRAKLDDERNGRGPGPTAAECLFLTGRTGVSADGGATVYRFHPDGGPLPTWRVMDGLRNGDAFPGAVRDDTAVFSTARAHPLAVVAFEVVLPDPVFRALEQRLDCERRASQYA